MPLFKKNTRRDNERRKSAQTQPEKELNVASSFPDEKIPDVHDNGSNNQKDLTDEPDEDTGTMSTLPPYRGPGSSISSPTDTDNKQTTTFSSNASSLNMGPDINPVTQNFTTADDGKEVYMPGSTSKQSPSILSATRKASRSYREYSFYYSNAMTHLIICDPDQQVLYFAEVSPFAKNMPDVCLRDVLGGGFDDLASKGTSLGLREAQHAPIVGVADSMPSSKHIKLGLGDPNQPESQKWTVMRNVHEDLKAGSEKYDMTMNRPGRKDVSYLWIRGAAGDQESSTDRSSKEQFRLLSDDGVVASFKNAALTSIKKRGMLRIYDAVGADDILVTIFLSCAALCERQRRRKVRKSLFLGL